MRTIKLFINGRPMSKDNEKLFSRRTRRPMTSPKFHNYARGVAWEASRQMKENGWTPFDIPVKVKMTFYFSTDQRLDLFNAPKSICDALNKIVWKDDRLIHQGYLILGYDERERVEIEVEPAYFVPNLSVDGSTRQGGYVLAPGTPKSIIKALQKAIADAGESWPVEVLI